MWLRIERGLVRYHRSRESQPDKQARQDKSIELKKQHGRPNLSMCLTFVWLVGWYLNVLVSN